MRAIMRGLTDAEFERRYGTEAECEAALVAVRLAAGMTCPSCANTRSYVYGRRVGCTRYPRRWSITSGTVMANTKLGLATWFRAMHLMTSTKQAISAMELGRRLGLRYDTAWYLHKRLRHAMRQQSETERLGGPGEDSAPIVEADDVYLGGERNEGRGTAGKTRVIAACERHAGGRMGKVALQVVARFSSAETRTFAQTRLAPAATIHTDRPEGVRRPGRGWTHARGHAHRRHAPRTRAHRPVLRRQHPDCQPQHRPESHPQAVLAQASARLSRRLLLDHEPTARHARHGSSPLHRCRRSNPAHPKNCLCLIGLTGG